MFCFPFLFLTCSFCKNLLVNIASRSSCNFSKLHQGTSKLWIQCNFFQPEMKAVSTKIQPQGPVSTRPTTQHQRIQGGKPDLRPKSWDNKCGTLQKFSDPSRRTYRARRGEQTLRRTISRCWIPNHHCKTNPRATNTTRGKRIPNPHTYRRWGKKISLCVNHPYPNPSVCAMTDKFSHFHKHNTSRDLSNSALSSTSYFSRTLQKQNDADNLS